MKTRPIGDRDQIWLLALVALHFLATCWFFPPAELIVDKPLFHIDYPVHTHRVSVYSAGFQEGRLPWGYDPAVGAGLVVSPYRDIGAKPMQVFGFFLPGVAAGTVVRLFLFLTTLLFPMGCLIASKLLELDSETTFWITASAASVLWLSWTIQLYLGWGLVSFVAAAALTPLVLALFTRFCRLPGPGTYLLLTGSLSALLLLHIQGPWPVALPLALLVLAVRPLSWRWRAAAILVPALAIALNTFWLVPAYLGSKMPPEPLNPTADYPVVKHLTLTAMSDFTSQIDPMWIITRLAIVALVVAGLTAIWRRSGPISAWSFGLATVWTFYISLFGSFTPFFERYQPVRFVVPGLVLLAVPLGSGVAAAIRRVGVDPRWLRGGFLVSAIALSVFTFRGPNPIPIPVDPDPLGEFIAARTSVDARLAIQSEDGLDKGGFEARAMALAYQREVIGCTYPKVAMPAQFLGDRILGRLFSQWTPEELGPALERWGIGWVFTRTDEARMLISRTVDDSGTSVGSYQAFQVPVENARFLIGSGEVHASVNRLELDDLDSDADLVVLRYRFHPAWTATPEVNLEAYPTPEDMAGFIALRDPPESLILEFDARSMLTAEWPGSED